MQLELVTIGTELLLGFTVDTNGAFLGRALAGAGARVVRRTAVPDDPVAIREAVAAALARTGAVVTTGGLGPTRDDMSKQVVAALFDAPLEFQQELWDALVARWAKMGRTIAEKNRCQAEIPHGATVLPNRWGTAPGLWLEGAPGLVIMLPGVPREMERLTVHEVVPRLAARAGSLVIRSRVLRTTGLPESTLAERVEPLEAALQPLTLAYLPSLSGVDLRLTAWGLPEADADRRLVEGIAGLRPVLGDHAYGEGEDDLAALLLGQLRQRGLRLAVAESCTGGLLGARLTAVPGSSDVFAGGIIAYANAAKESLLAVPSETLARDGAVSEAVAGAMAEGAARALGATVAVAITGVAGPGGGTAEKPVGLVCFGFVIGNRMETRHVIFPGERDEIRARAAQLALHRLSLLTRDLPE